jgi:hypothetical protein
MADVVTSALWPVGGMVVGGVITWFCYAKAAIQLRSETAELRRLTTFVLRGMEEGGLAELNRDESGRITGLVLKGRASLRGAAAVSARGMVVRGRQPRVGTLGQSAGNENA